MTKDEVANMETFMIVEKICSDNYMVWNEHLGFRSAFHLFCVRHHQIRVLLRKLEKLQGFKSFQLELFKFQMVEQTKALASQLRIFAFSNDMAGLMDKLNFTIPERESKAWFEKAKEILDIAVANGVALRNWDISMLMLGELEQSIESYQLCSADPKLVKQEMEQLDLQIADLIRSAKNILRDNLDPQVVSFKWSDRHFHDLYVNARGNHPTYTASLQGTVIDDATHLPIGSADITISELNVSRHITPLGHFIFYHLPPGTYHAKVQKFGYEDRLIEVIVPERDGEKSTSRCTTFSAVAQDIVG